MVNIWNYEGNQAIETDKVDLKPFKPSGKFFDDVQTLVRLFGIQTHPALRETTYRDKETIMAQAAAADGSQEDQQVKEITSLNFYKYRLDRNSLRVTFMCLPSAVIIQTLKFSNNGLTHSQLQTLIGYLAEDNCPITNLFLDWNPLYTDDYQAGD